MENDNCANVAVVVKIVKNDEQEAHAMEKVNHSCDFGKLFSEFL